SQSSLHSIATASHRARRRLRYSGRRARAVPLPEHGPTRLLAVILWALRAANESNVATISDVSPTPALQYTGAAMLRGGQARLRLYWDTGLGGGDGDGNPAGVPGAGGLQLSGVRALERDRHG